MSDCIFCKIVAKEVPSEIIYEDEEILAFKDINPVTPVHILIIPKKHIPDMTAITEKDAPVIGRMHLVANKIAKDFEIDETGYRLVNNCKEDGGQMVYHLHYHLLGGRKMGIDI